ncbi:hypothetical protein B0H13DRAFT_385396 [Mycena leptocephala]|nr:hypothetical protein B0H13DRAFT_385396 [Mycena leptocephala]
MLNNASRHGGEPLNVIISRRSTPSVLTDAGFLGYAGALGFADECLGFHIGDRQPANLGDGHGWVDEGMVLREDFGSAAIGTCWESVVGGNHLRMYRQNGPAANSGALFLAVSHERNFLTHHTISPDGYNLGRDLLVARATTTRTVFKGVRYATSVRRLEGLLGVGKGGINHSAYRFSYLPPFPLGSFLAPPRTSLPPSVLFLHPRSTSSVHLASSELRFPPLSSFPPRTFFVPRPSILHPRPTWPLLPSSRAPSFEFRYPTCWPVGRGASDYDSNGNGDSAIRADSGGRGEARTLGPTLARVPGH